MHSAEWLEAVLYDWHNEHLLHRQRQDQSFYATALADSEITMVLGAGTGRVSTPIADHSRGTVLAIDRSLSRLNRAPWRGNVVPIVADIRSLPFPDCIASAAVYPYSTFQMLESHDDRVSALAEARRTLSDDAILFIDISNRFEDRPQGQSTRIALEAPCRELGAVVTETEETESKDDHLVITRTFHQGGELLAVFAESWYFASALRLPEILPAAGFTITEIINGYSADTTHRRIYLAQPAG